MNFQNTLNVLSKIFISDDRVQEILVHGIHNINVVMADASHSLPTPFQTQEELIDWIYELASTARVRLDALHPINGGVFENQGMFRWHAVIPPACENSALLVIRKVRFGNLSLTDFEDPFQFLPMVKASLNVGRPLLICGPTGSGKTSLLATLINEMYSPQRVIILETIRELYAMKPTWLHLVARPANVDNKGALGLSTLLAESLRLRPDLFVIGELRVNEAQIFMEAIHTGHGAVLSTMHAASVKDVKQRFLAVIKESTSLTQICCLFLERGERPKLAHCEQLILCDQK